MKTLVLGGVKSGKSRYAENILQTRCSAIHALDSELAVIVTGQPLDQAMAQRIAKHKLQRPAGWHVIEAPLDLPSAILSAEARFKIVMIDCLTLWLTNLLMQDDPERLQAELDRFIAVVEESPLELIIVSNETNMGIMPLGQLTRDYCDLIGILHQRLAQVMQDVVLVVAGLPLQLKQAAPDSSESVQS